MRPAAAVAEDFPDFTVFDFTHGHIFSKEYIFEYIFFFSLQKDLSRGEPVGPGPGTGNSKNKT